MLDFRNDAINEDIGNQVESLKSQDPDGVSFWSVGDDFKGDTINIPPNLRRGSAAHAAYMRDNSEGIYNKIMNEWYTDPAYSPTYGEINEQSWMQHQKELEESYASLLSSEDVPEDVKKAVAKDFQENSQLETPIEVREGWIESFEDDDRTARRKAQTEDLAFDIVRDAYEYNTTKQRVRNAFEASSEQGIAGTAADFVGAILPILNQRPLNKTWALLKEHQNDPDVLSKLGGNPFRGELKKDMKEIYDNLPIDSKVAFLKSLADLMESGAGGRVLVGSNELMKMEAVNTLLGDYDGDDDSFPWERVFDDVFSTLDYVGVGSLFAGVAKGIGRIRAVGKLNKALDEAGKEIYTQQKEALLDYIRGNTMPMSLGSTVENRNPKLVTELYHRALADDTGKIAEDVFGISREELRATKSVPAPKVEGLEDYVDTSVNTKNVLDRAKIGNILALTSDEVSEAMGKVSDSLVVNGFEYKPASSKIMTKGGEGGSNDVVIEAVYGMGKGEASVSPSETIERLAKGLAHYGVERGDITPLVRTKGDVYKPLVGRAPRPGDEVLFRVNFDYDLSTFQGLAYNSISPRKVSFLSGFKNLTGKTQGTLIQHGFNPESMFPKYIMDGAFSGVDLGIQITKDIITPYKQALKSFGKLPNNEKAFIEQYVKKANHDGIPYDYKFLKENGVSDGGVDFLRQFRRTQDLIWRLNNIDRVKGFQKEGYWMYTNSNNTSLILKNIQREFWENTGGRDVYDPVSGTIRTMKKEEILELYDNGGFLANSKNRININEERHIGGKDAMPVLVKNTEEETYRAFKNTDTPIPYREGYFHVSYKSPWYIEEVSRDAKGNEVIKVVGTAGSRKGMERLKAELQANGGENVTYSGRKAKELQDKKDLEQSLDFHKGFSAERMRGETLATDQNNIPWDSPYVENPFTTVFSEARNVGDRIMLRDWVETMKQRWYQEFGDLVEKGSFKQDVWPTDPGMIKSAPDNYQHGRIGSARESWAYINQMEGGLTNLIDDGWKSFMNEIADAVGHVSELGEKAVRVLGKKGVFESGRGLANLLYITWAPFRQLFINAHQSVQLAAMFPKEFPHVYTDAMAMVAKRAGYKIKDNPNFSNSFYDEMTQGYINSGLSAAIDSHSVLRGASASVVDESLGWVAKTGGLGGRLADVGAKTASDVNKIAKSGFQTGEEINQMTAYSAVFRKKKAEVGGRKLTNRELQEVGAEARNVTLGFNRAGDYAYNQNTLNGIFQFAQVPHKALNQMLTNRSLTGSQRLRLTTFNMLMYGPPSFLPFNAFYDVIYDPENGLSDGVREALMWGGENYVLNAFLSAATGQKVDINYSGTSPLDVQGQLDIWGGLLDEGVLGVIANSPAGSLFAGNSPRVANALKAVAKSMFATFDPLDNANWKDTVGTIGQLSSQIGYVFKANLAYKYGVEYSKSGRAYGANVTPPESLLMGLFGFNTNEMQMRINLEGVRQASTKEINDLAKTLYNANKQYLMGSGTKSPEEISQHLQSINMIKLGIPEEQMPAFQKSWNGLVERDLRDGQYSLGASLYQAMGQGYFTGDQTAALKNMFVSNTAAGGVVDDYTKKLIKINQDIERAVKAAKENE